jgi:hypothetical protein
MAFCTNCGTQAADGTKFCTSCGTPITVATAQAVQAAPPPPPPASASASLPAAPPPPPPVESAYAEIDLLDYLKAWNNGSIEEGQKFKSRALFDMQSGEEIYFDSLDGKTVVNCEMTTQAPKLKAGQKVTIYYAKIGKEIHIDEIEVETETAAPETAVPPPQPVAPPVNSASVDSSGYQGIDFYEFYLGRKKGKMQSGKFVIDVLFSDWKEDEFYCRDPEEGDVELTFEVTKRPPELEYDDQITIYIHCEGDANPIIDNIVVQVSSVRKESVEPRAATYRAPMPVYGADTMASITDLGREMADQLKNAAKEQLDKLNPLKGLFGRK